MATQGDASDLRLRQALQAGGQRFTEQRAAVYRYLAGTDIHPTADEVFSAVRLDVPGISLATVYRTMKALEESGAIQRHAFAGGPARFEQAPAAHHDHLIDLDTGEVIEFASPAIEKLQEEIAARLGYRIVSHRLELYGRKLKG